MSPAAANEKGGRWAVTLFSHIRAARPGGWQLDQPCIHPTKYTAYPLLCQVFILSHLLFLWTKIYSLL